MNKLTPQQYIKWMLIKRGAELGYDRCSEVVIVLDTIDDLYDDLEDELQDVRYEFREGGVETHMPCRYSRHYESYSVAAQAPDGQWVGWTYWYGGGRDAEPEAIDWEQDAYFLDCIEEEKVVTVRTFSL